MFKHHLKLFFRNLLKYKSTFLINIIGLSTGLACVVLIALWVVDELQFDGFHQKDTQLYQVWNRFESPEGLRVLSWTPELLAETMADKLPEVQYATGQTLPEWFPKMPLTVDGQITKAPGIFADTDYFHIFSYELLQGDENQVLTGTNSIVISESLGRRLFGTLEGVVGKTIQWEAMGNQGQQQVSGVFKDIPQNSSNRFDFILPYQLWKNAVVNNGGDLAWTSNNPSTYIVLAEGTDPTLFAQKIKNFSKQQDQEVTAELVMTKYSSNYLYGNFENGQQASGRMDYVYLFSLIALFILIIACINFMNLSTANATRRLKEIGVKKALGSQRSTLIKQYFGESMMTASFSLLLALVLVLLFIPVFNSITGKVLALQFNWPTVLGMVTVVLFTGLLAGSYPAFHLSRFNPVIVLKGNLKSALGEVWVRKGLVVFQFSLSIILIIAVLLVYQQVDFVQSKNLGLNKDNVLYFTQEGKLKQNTEPFLNEIRQLNGVVNAATASQNIIGTDINMTGGLMWSGNEEQKRTRFNEMRIGHDFIETMDMRLKEGRAFSKDFATDSTAIVFNETAIDLMGLQDPIGKNVTYGNVVYTIIGVLNDFHFQSLRKKVNPMFFRLQQKTIRSEIVVRISNAEQQEALAALSEKYARFNPGYVFEYTFLDANFQAEYVAEKRVASLSKYFAGLAILISCLGLFGLATFTAERRRKEIGIRKVLGQSAAQVALMLSGEFAKLVFMAILVALPVSYLLASDWLSGFAYRIPLSIWYFIGAGIMALLVAILTVGSQAIRAATKNPVNALRDQ